MALEWEIVSTANCIVVSWNDDFDADEYLSFYRDLSNAPDFQPHLSRLYDLRQTRIPMKLDDLRSLSVNIQRDEDKHGKRRVVFLVDSDLNFGLIRQFVTTAAILSADYHISRDSIEAKRFAGLDPEYVLIPDR